MKLAWALVCRADWDTMTTWPGWDTLIQASGLSRSVVASRLRLFREIGWLGTVEHGSTPMFRPGVLHALPDLQEGNRRAVYVLCVPAPAAETATVDHIVDRSRTPTEISSKDRKDTGRNARASNSDHSARFPAAAAEIWRASATPGTKAARLAASAEVRRRSLVLRRLTVRRIGQMLSPWFDADWAVADVLYALDHTPDGAPWRYAGPVQRPAGWARHRLAFWLQEGKPLPSRSTQLRAQAAQRRAEQRAAHQAVEEANRRRADTPPALVADVRAQLMSRLASRPKAYWRAQAHREHTAGRLCISPQRRQNGRTVT